MKIRKSIDHFTGREQNALLHIRKVITDTLNPELLFFLNSQAFTSLRRDYLVKDLRSENFHLSCTLLAIVPEQQDEGLISALENQLLSFGKVNLIVYPMERFVLELQNKSFFLPTIYRHAILLFEQQKGCFRDMLQTVYQEPVQRNTAHQEDHLPEPVSVNSLHPLFSYVFYPHCLNQEEIKNPFIVLFRFFDMADFINAQREVNIWMEAIGQYRDWKKNEAAKQLTFYEAINKLIEAVHFINQMDNSNRPAVISDLPEQEHVQRVELFCPAGTEDAWLFFPRSLSREQFVNPYLVFKDFFAFWSLQEWKEELHNLLHLSFSHVSLADFGGDINLLTVKLHLDRLVEACHLVLVREPEITVQCRTKQRTGA